MKFITDTIRNIYVDELEHGDNSYISVREDPDGLGCIEVSYRESDKPVHNSARLTMTPEQAVAVANAILLQAAELLKK